MCDTMCVYIKYILDITIRTEGAYAKKLEQGLKVEVRWSEHVCGTEGHFVRRRHEAKSCGWRMEDECLKQMGDKSAMPNLKPLETKRKMKGTEGRASKTKIPPEAKGKQIWEIEDPNEDFDGCKSVRITSAKLLWTKCAVVFGDLVVSFVSPLGS